MCTINIVDGVIWYLSSLNNEKEEKIQIYLNYYNNSQEIKSRIRFGPRHKNPGIALIQVRKRMKKNSQKFEIYDFTES